MKALTCEMCGSNDLVLENGVYVCKYCGTQYTLEESDSINNRESGVYSAPVAGKNAYDIKFASIKNHIHNYFSIGPNCVRYKGNVGYDAVIKMLGELEVSGGASDSKYFETFADFFSKAQVEGAKTGALFIQDPDSVIAGYKRVMELAMNNASGTEINDLKDKTAKQLDWLNKELFELYKRNCPRCGAENKWDAEFCGNCGNKFISRDSDKISPHGKIILITVGVIVCIIIWLGLEVVPKLNSNSKRKFAWNNTEISYQAIDVGNRVINTPIVVNNDSGAIKHDE